MASRKLTDLHPDLQPLAIEFLRRCKEQGIDVLVTCTYRSHEEQNGLYAQGRTIPGSIVTRAKGGQSLHNFTIDDKPASQAFDIVPLVNGKPIWNANDPIWKKVGDVYYAMPFDGKYKLNWLGKSNTVFPDYPHFELQEIK